MIIENNNLKKIISVLKKKKKKIVHCHGVFDVIHAGHIKYFKQAKKLGEILIVSITSDQFVNKGSERPFFKINDRMQVINQIKDIDYVIESNFPTAKNMINIIKPNFYCKGPDYKRANRDLNLKNELKALKLNHGVFKILSHIKKSSTKIINKKNNPITHKFSIDNSYLNTLKDKYSLTFLKKKVAQFKKLNVFVTGELIIDKYIFTEILGKSGKDVFTVLKKKNEIKFLGGSAYIANICAKLVKKTYFTSFIGDKRSYSSFITNNLDNKIKATLLKKKNSSTFLKLRYIDEYKLNKIIGSYDINDNLIDNLDEKKYIKSIKDNIKKCDLVIVADYGHGIITPKINKLFKTFSKKINLNCQINSFNKGFNSVSKFKSVNSIVMNENELRNELKDKESDIENLCKKIKKKIKFKSLYVTRGKFGACLYRSNKFYYAPSFALENKDTIGAGDTFLSISSLTEHINCPPDLSLFLSSLYASYSVLNIGNKETLSFDNFLKIVHNLLGFSQIDNIY